MRKKVKQIGSNDDITTGEKMGNITDTLKQMEKEVIYKLLNVIY